MNIHIALISKKTLITQCASYDMIQIIDSTSLEIFRLLKGRFNVCSF